MQRTNLVASVAALFLLGSTATPMRAQGHHSDYDEVDPWTGFESPRPAADSLAVAQFLNGLSRSDPLICQFAVNSIGNHWGPGDRDQQIGVLAGESRMVRERDAWPAP